jgi:hypothetical protein
MVTLARSGFEVTAIVTVLLGVPLAEPLTTTSEG